MKLTEQQLAQLFQHSKDTAVESVMGDLNEFSDASAARLNALEEIANNSTLSAGQHIINNMESWSTAIATEVHSQTKPTFTSQIMKWLQPSIAVAAVVTAIYFIAPVNQQSIEPQTKQISHQLSTLTQKSDRIMYSSSFEKGNNSAQSTQLDTKADVISKFNFS